MNTEKNRKNSKKSAFLIAALLAASCLCSLIYLLLPQDSHNRYVADIYQDGNLIMSIPLYDAGEDRVFTLTGANGGSNEIEVLSGAIRIRSADCPDKLCVRQGFVRNSRLPITCLPNRLVIRLRPASAAPGAGEPDAVTH